MATRERAVDRGRERGRDLIRLVGREIRLARRGLGLSLKVVAAEVGISIVELSRIERGLAPWVSLLVLAQICEVVGLELSVKTYPGGRPLRDARHGTLLGKLRRKLHPRLGWSTEVPMPMRGDKRSWDGAIRGPDWFCGVEAELNPVDGRALIRRLRLKLRDSGADGLILLMPDTRQTRRFLREFADLLANDFPVGGRQALDRLAAGQNPGGSAVVIL